MKRVDVRIDNERVPKGMSRWGDEEGGDMDLLKKDLLNHENTYCHNITNIKYSNIYDVISINWISKRYVTGFFLY